jgi:hypothetical protein
VVPLARRGSSHRVQVRGGPDGGQRHGVIMAHRRLAVQGDPRIEAGRAGADSGEAACSKI